MNPPSVTDIELMSSLVIRRPCRIPTTRPTPTAMSAPPTGEWVPVCTASMPPSRKVEETDRSNSPAIMVSPSASVTRPRLASVSSTLLKFTVSTVEPGWSTGRNRNTTNSTPSSTKGRMRCERWRRVARSELIVETSFGTGA
jgi:hypothetical protein